MAASESEKKCELCLYPAHLQCKCVSSPVFVCPSCVLRHIRKDPEGTHRFFPLDEAMEEVERQRAKGKSRASARPKVEEAPARVATPPREVRPALPPAADPKPSAPTRPTVPTRPTALDVAETKPSAPKEDKEVARVYTCPLCKAVLKNFLVYKGHMKQHVTE